jgi:hypothetical protein
LGKGIGTRVDPVTQHSSDTTSPHQGVVISLHPDVIAIGSYISSRFREIIGSIRKI